MFSLLPLWGRAALVAAVIAVLSGTGWYVKGVFTERTELREKVAADAEQLRLATRFNKVTTTILTQRVKSAAAIQKKAELVQIEIVKRIPDDIVLPPDWRVLHDAATTTADAVPPAPGGTDAASVAASEALATVTRNYEASLDNADRLLKLQAWVDGVSKGQPK